MKRNLLIALIALGFSVKASAQVPGDHWHTIIQGILIGVSSPTPVQTDEPPVYGLQLRTCAMAVRMTNPALMGMTNGCTSIYLSLEDATMLRNALETFIQDPAGHQNILWHRVENSGPLTPLTSIRSKN